MPTTLLQGQQITRHRGARTILDAVDIQVDPGSRIGLIGPNGSGKSTLLRILTGAETPDAGTVTRFGTVGYLPQFADLEARRFTVRETILERIGLASAITALDFWAGELADGNLDAVEPHGAALEQWLALGGDDIDSRLRAAADELGLGERLLDRTLASLSGGQAARAGLAALRVARFDVVLLDEPTNHLDADGLSMLGSFMRARAGGIVLVSHDRGLLADAANEILELDRRTGQAATYRGGWETYLRERAAARQRIAQEREDALARRAKLKAAEHETRQRAAAAVRRARAGQLPDDDKHQREWVKMRAEERSGRARKMGERAERIEIPDAPWEDRALRLHLTPAERRQTWVISLEGAIVRRGVFSLGPLDLAVAHGDRVLVSGANGSGKSTLLGALAGEIELVEGRRRVASGALVAQLGQGRDLLGGDERISTSVRRLTGVGQSDARTALATFGLGPDLTERSATTLSPGERTRAELTVLALRRATCLLLDEPTNHLDTESLEVLEAALADWPGALLVATHDQTLEHNLQLNRVLAL